jgi:predicted RND superfamily exporter protein
VAYALVSGQAGGIPGRTIKVVIEGVNFARLRDIKQEIESLDGVTSVYQRSFASQKAELDVVAEKTSEGLAVDLERLGIEISSLSANTVEGKNIK